MSASIFSNLAPDFWQAGYSVVPMRLGTKMPAVQKWSGYCDNLPGEQKRQDWIDEFGQCGIGLLLGTEIVPGFRLIAIDIDDDRLIQPVRALLNGDCGKFGRKGVTLFVKSPVEDKIKATTFKGPEGHVGDLLASGKVTVLPPSIHPETGQAYKWIAPTILDHGFDGLPLFDRRVLSVLQCVCGSQHLRELQKGGATHTSALQFVAQLVKAGAQDTEIKQIVEACLPSDYAGDTLAQLDEMIQSARDKGFGDLSSEEKTATLAIQIINLCLQQGAEVFRWEDRAYISIPTPSGGCVSYLMRGRATERWIRHIWFKSEGRSMGPMVLNEVIATLETKAFADGQSFPVWNRVGLLEENIYVDLGREDALLIKISETGWEPAYEPRVKFRRPDGFKELPLPKVPGDLRALQCLLGLSEEVFYSTVAFMISSMAPKGPYFGLIIEGEMGSGKSVLASSLKALLDPNDADRLSLPTNDRDLAIHANQFRLLSYDNASGIKSLVSDALCIVATGGGLATRKLYTDDELAVLKASRPFILNGISGYARRPDLIERAIYVHLERVPKEERKEERVLTLEFNRQAPHVLGGLYDALSVGLRNIKKGINPTGLRMADAATRIMASEEALGIPAGTLISAIQDGQRALIIERISSDGLTVGLKEILKRGPFEGTIKELFERLRGTNEDDLPRSPAALSSALDRQRGGLQEVGIFVKLLQRSKQGRRVKIEYVDPPEDAPASASKPEY
jgi:hypothetical protein